VAGELVIDDIQIDAADRQVFPNQLAWWLRATAPLPAALPATARLEYRHVNSFTYLRARSLYDEVYQQYDRPLGSTLGPDADLVRGEADVWLNGNMRVAGGVGLWRHGARRIEQRPTESMRGHANDPFPSVSPARPAVQRAALADLAAQLLTAQLPITARVELARIDNVNNRLQPAALYMRAQLVGTYAFRYP
jgi:hypothetical protein